LYFYHFPLNYTPFLDKGIEIANVSNWSIYIFKLEYPPSS
jgi:hypothetical protein